MSASSTRPSTPRTAGLPRDLGRDRGGPPRAAPGPYKHPWQGGAARGRRRRRGRAGRARGAALHARRRPAHEVHARPIAFSEIGRDQAGLRIVMREGDLPRAARRFHERIVRRGHEQAEARLRLLAERAGAGDVDVRALAILLASVINYRVLDTLFEAARRPPEDRYIEAWADLPPRLLETHGLLARPRPRRPADEQRRPPDPQPGVIRFLLLALGVPQALIGLWALLRAALVLRRLPVGHRRLGPHARAVRRAPGHRRGVAVRGARRGARVRRVHAAPRRVIAAAVLARVRRAPLPLARLQPRALRHGRRDRQHAHARLDRVGGVLVLVLALRQEPRPAASRPPTATARGSSW